MTYINENFDSLTPPALPSGWTSSGGTAVSTTTTAYSGTKSLALSGLSGNYGFAWKAGAVEDNGTSTRVRAKMKPDSVGGGSVYWFLYGGSGTPPSGNTRPDSGFCFFGNFNNEGFFGFQDAGSAHADAGSATLTPGFSASEWYEVSFVIERDLDYTAVRLVGYVQRVSDGAWLCPDNTWQVGVETPCLTSSSITPTAYAGVFSVCGCYLASGRTLYVDDFVFENSPGFLSGQTPASPPAAGVEVELIPTATTFKTSANATDSGATGTGDLNDGDVLAGYVSSGYGGYVVLDFGSGHAVTPTAVIWASGSVYQEYDFGCTIDGANSASGPWTNLGVTPLNEYPRVRQLNTLRLDSSSPGGTYRYIRFKNPTAKTFLSEFRILATAHGGASWRPAPPRFSQQGGSLVAGSTVTLTGPTSGSSVYYTVGTTSSPPADPTTGSTLYTGPITVATHAPEETIIKAICSHASGTTTTSTIETGYFIVGKTFVPDTGINGPGGVHWPGDARDTNGRLLQINNTDIIYSGGLYHATGANWDMFDASGYQCRAGWRRYTSTDLFNWTDVGGLLMPVPPAWGAVATVTWQTRLHLLENPSPLDANNKFVAIAHLGGYGGYVAFAAGPSLTALTWRGYSRPNSTNVGDTNVFYDVVEDGTGHSRNKAWLVFNEDDQGLRLCQLDPATDWLSFTGSNLSVGGTTNAPEAPVVFHNDGYYYALSSAGTAWGEGNSRLRYRSATTLAGLAGASQQSIWSSSPSSADVAYNTQTTGIIKVRGLSASGYILMTDIQDTGESPVDMFHSRAAWYPLSTVASGNAVNAFPSAGTLSVVPATSWDMTYLPVATGGGRGMGSRRGRTLLVP